MSLGEPIVAPAQLSFLAIYNPTFGHGEDSIRDQILFYSSKQSRERLKQRSSLAQTAPADHEEENERLRQVGLAQGMIDFAKNFSEGEPVDSIETEKSRIVLHELESNWWILASIDLTRLPTSRRVDSNGTVTTIEYSSREVSSPQLLLQQIRQAHYIFLLHHGTSLADIYLRLPKTEFCGLLDRFWGRFVRDWDVLLHGNPAVDIYNGIKLAAGGELGIGVGEEEHGSAEREVLEGFISRTDGLLDLVVSRFGDAPADLDLAKTTPGQRKQHELPWLGQDQDPQPSDGVVFSGVGNVSRNSLATISQWMESIFKYGEQAYGVRENPASKRRRRRRGLEQPAGQPPNSGNASRRDLKRMNGTSLHRQAVQTDTGAPVIPPPLVTTVEHSLQKATSGVNASEAKNDASGQEGKPKQPESESLFDTEKMKKYLTLGYGSAWSFTAPTPVSHKPASSTKVEASSQPEINISSKAEGSHELPEGHNAESRQPSELTEIDPRPELDDEEQTPYVQHIEPSVGRFIIGLIGDLEKESLPPSPRKPSDLQMEASEPVHNNRIVLRTLNIEIKQPSSPKRPLSPTSRNGEQHSSLEEEAQPIHQKVQIAVYVHQPFIFTFIFALHTLTLTYPAFYRSIDHQLGPLQRSLLASTDPKRALERIKSLCNEDSKSASFGRVGLPPEPIYDLVYDPVKATIRCSIPNIPAPGSLAAEGLTNSSSPYTSGSWLSLGIPTSASATTHTSSPNGAAATINRMQALNLHTHILNLHSSTRRLSHEVERSVKTNRGFWVMWIKIPPHISETLNPTLDMEARLEESGGKCKQALLVRRTRDTVRDVAAGKVRTTSAGRWLRDRNVSGSSTGSADRGNEGVTEGVGGGFDARRYVEALMRLNR
ncbi:MAG: hypothetical protein Q9227_006572 [Pyrenula ochraceoflavens]